MSVEQVGSGARVWIGHSTEDAVVAAAIAHALVANGVMCALSAHDPSDSTGPGEPLERCALYIAVISPAAIGSQSLRDEARRASLRLPLVLFCLDDTRPPVLGAHLTIDASSTAAAFDDGVRRLVTAVLLQQRFAAWSAWRLRSNVSEVLHSEVMKHVQARCDVTRSVDWTVERDLLPPEAQDVVPPPITDRVHFSVTSSPVWPLGQPALLDIWAHLDDQRDEVLERAREDGERMIRSAGPVPLARGSQLTVRLQIDGLVVDEPEDTLLWDSEIGQVTFCVRVPADTAEGRRAAVATMHLGGLRILSLRFAVELRRVGAPARAQALAIRETRHRSAFASYASVDEAAVLARVQGISKGQPQIDIFYAPHTLRSGEDWKLRLREEIERRDVFYLFWSKAARDSTHVEWEWRYALEVRGIDYIDPVPLVSPAQVPPPEELASLHFNDWMLARMTSCDG